MAAGAGLRAAAEAIVGGALRAVAAYDERDYELEYIRDDVGRRYSAAELEAVFEELALAGRDRDYLEGIFHAGRIECSILGFEDALMFHFVTDGGAGRLVTVDRDVEFDLDEFVEACRAAIG